MELNRRGLLGGLLALVAAPAIVRVENLMALPKPAIIVPELILPETAVDYVVKNNLMTIREITMEAVSLFRNSNAFMRSLDMQYDEQFALEGARIGNSLRIRYPEDFVISDGPLVGLS